MSNSKKRCMLYWWFVTHFYAICGSKKRAPLPNFLVPAVLYVYPSHDGKYTGYEENKYIGGEE